jgi:hypothetical protein
MEGFQLGALKACRGALQDVHAGKNLLNNVDTTRIRHRWSFHSRVHVLEDDLGIRNNRARILKR